MANQEAPGMGHNSDLTDDQQRALAYLHKEKYEAAESAKKKADAELKNTAKRAKADGVNVEDIRILQRLETPEGEASFRAEMKRRMQVAAWAANELGQFEFFNQPDRTPLEDRAYEEGKIAGFSNKPARTPEGYSGNVEQRWLSGHADGTAARLSVLERATADAPAEEPKKRGRPKGSKNKAPKVEPVDVAEGEASPFDEAA